VKSARVALRIGQAALPAYGRGLSKRCFIPPQLLAILCLMCDEDRTFREAEVRVAEPGARRAARGLRHGPDYTTLYRFLRRLAELVLEPIVSAAVHRLMPQPSPPATVAVKATGLTPGAVSTFFIKRAQDRAPGLTWRYWLKETPAVDVECRVMLAQTARRGSTPDGATWRPLRGSAGSGGAWVIGSSSSQA
jgi:hypothetical protein